MNGISIEIKPADHIGHVEAARNIGKLNGAEVFIDDIAGRLIICQPDQCLVIG